MRGWYFTSKVLNEPAFWWKWPQNSWMHSSPTFQYLSVILTFFKCTIWWFHNFTFICNFMCNMPGHILTQCARKHIALFLHSILGPAWRRRGLRIHDLQAPIQLVSPFNWSFHLNIEVKSWILKLDLTMTSSVTLRCCGLKHELVICKNAHCDAIFAQSKSRKGPSDLI